MAANNMFVNLRLNIQDFSRNLERAANSMARFAATAASNSMGANRQFAQYGRQISDATSALNKHNFGLKDTTRIIQGILVSQAFYGLAGVIRDATQSVWNFNEALDYAHVTYSALFGDSQLSTNFMQVLREHAENTVFSYEQLAESSKKLLAYNIPYENLMYVMGGLTDLGAMSGDAAALDRIALALGQIYTRGKLSAEEMRQLANAYVPIYDIIKNKFGLSGEDMGRVGDLNLPAHEVINAVVDYANETFGGVGDAAMLTITGLKQKISDSLKNLAVDMLKPFTAVYKSLLKFLAEQLEAISSIYAKSGLGGVFEYLVPDEAAQQRIRQFIANLQILASTARDLFSVFVRIGSSFATGFINAFNVIAPVVNTAARAVAQALAIITSNAAGLNILTSVLVGCAMAWVLFKAKALSAMAIGAVAKVLYTVAGAVIFLARALAASPLVAGLILITAGLAGIAANARGADSAIGSLFDKLTGISGGGGGAGGGGVLQPEEQLEDANDALDDFNDRLEGTEENIEDIGNAAGGAGSAAKKAAAGLLSFDEVFKLNENKAGGGGDGYDVDDMLSGLDSLGGGIGDSLIPEIPDFSDFGEKFVNALTGTLLGKLALAGFGALVARKLSQMLADTALAGKLTPGAKSLVQALGKALMGASIGLAFDAVASLLTDKLWEALEDKLKLSESSSEAASFGATLGSVLGGVIGTLVGGIGGGAIGAAIGHLAGGIVGLLSDEIGKAFSNTALFGGVGIAGALAKAFGGSIAQLPSLIGANTISGVFKNIGGLFAGAGLKAVAKGGVIGMAVGFVCDAIAALLWNTLQEKFNLSANSTETAKVGQTIGSVLGAVIGGLIGGPAGVLIGSAIGTFAGGFVGLFWEKISAFFAPVAARVGEMVGGIADGLETAASGIADWASTSWAGLREWASGTWESLTGWISDTKLGFSDWWNETTAIFSDWDSINSETLGTWATSTFEDFTGWVADTVLGFAGWKNDTESTFSSWKKDTTEKFIAWKLGVTLPVTNFVDETREAISTWCAERINDFYGWAVETGQEVADWVEDTRKDISDWVTKTTKSVSDFKDSAIRTIEGFAIASGEAIADWARDTWNDIDEWFDGLVEDVKNWWDSAWDTSNWDSGWTMISSWFSNIFVDIHNWFTGLKGSVKDWWSGIFSDLSGDVSLNATMQSNLQRGNARPRGFATGGIVSRDQLIRVAEGNKAEAVIPLQNSSAMQPFVDAVSAGLTGNILPTLLASNPNGSSGLPPMYVGTLIADERGLKQLYKKFEVIRLQESARTGTPAYGGAR